MNEEKTNIVPYNKPQKDYSNSNRSKMATSGGATPPATTQLETSHPPQGTITTSAKSEGFFKATLKEAVDHAVKTVIDPMIRNFVYSTGMSVLNTLLWNGGKGAPWMPNFGPGPNATPYNLISTPMGGQSSPRQQQLTQQDRVWQRYEKLHVPTLDEANSIMSRLYRHYMREGRVTLAQYYEAFGEKYDFTNETWGWTSLPKDKMYAQQFADGYHVIMPKLEGLV